MSTFTNFHTWVTGETMTAALLNGITNSLVTAGNSIDRTNLTAGAGIDASQIKPSSGAAGTFGGSVAYTFPLALVTTVGSNSVVPLTIQGNSGGGQTAAIFQTQLAPAGTVLGQQNPAGDLQIAPLINSVNTLGRVAPVYTNGGSSVGATFHMVFGQTSLTTSGNTLNNTLASWTTSNTVTLSGAAVYTSTTSYGGNCVDLDSHNGQVQVVNLSASTFNLTYFNNTGATLSGGAIFLFSWVLFGT